MMLFFLLYHLHLHLILNIVLDLEDHLLEVNCLFLFKNQVIVLTMFQYHNDFLIKDSSSNSD